MKQTCFPIELQEIAMIGLLHYLTVVTYKGNEYWYIELQRTVTLGTKKEGFTGTIYKLSKEGLKEVTQTLLHEGTTSVVSAVLPDENRDCFFFLYLKRGELYCEEKKQAAADHPIKLELYQTFNYIHNGFKVSKVQGIKNSFKVRLSNFCHKSCLLHFLTVFKP